MCLVVGGWWLFLGFDRGAPAGGGGPGRGRFNEGNRGRGNFRGSYNDRESERSRGSGGFSRSAPVKEHRPSPEFKEPTIDAAAAAARPRLKLLPRSVKDPVNAVADTSNRSSIFGEAKPRDEKVFTDKKIDLPKTNFWPWRGNALSEFFDTLDHPLQSSISQRACLHN